MLTSNDLKKFFDPKYSFEQNGKMIYQVPLKEFMKTEEFARLSPVSRIEKDGKEIKCQFLNSSSLTDVYPHMIIKKTKSEKTVWFVDLDERVVSGTWPDLEYDFMVRVNEDGTLNRDFVHEVQKGRFKNNEGKFLNTWYYKNSYAHYGPVEYPRYYRDPSF